MSPALGSPFPSPSPAAAPLYADSAWIPRVYSSLKDLHLITGLVENGRASATIVVPSGGIYDAAHIQRAILERPEREFDVPITPDC